MTRLTFVLCLLLCALPTLAAPTRYHITFLPGMDVEEETDSTFINNKGMVACDNIDTFTGNVWWKGKTWTIHNPLFNQEYYETHIGGLNDAGTVVGTFHGEADGAWLMEYGRVFVWRKGQTFLLPPPKETSSFYDPVAKCINPAGDILVNVYAQSPAMDESDYNTYVYHAGHPQLRSHGSERRVSNAGQFVATPDPQSVAPLSGYVWGVHGVGSGGVLVGQYQHQGILRACLWKNGRCVDLGPASGKVSIALGINNRGQVVGQFDAMQQDNKGMTARAFLWQNGCMTDLNKLIPAHSGWVLTEADAINDRGQIVCAGNKGACLLTPVTTTQRRP